MTKWIEQNKKIVLIILLVLFVGLSSFYFFLIRPLAAEEKSLQDQLNRISEDTSFYQSKINQLKPQSFTDEEKLLLVGSVPGRPNVEEVITELEKTELETGVAIENISFSINSTRSNEAENPSNNQTEVGAQANEEAQANQPVQQQGSSSWEQILPKETLERLKEKFVDVTDLNVSYVEMVIDLNGEVEDVNTFVNQLENLKRIIHVQSYDYSINEEKNNRLEGILTIRAFYSEDFAKFINADSDFKLDYTFDPTKIKRYIEPVLPTSQSDESKANNEISTNDPKEEVVEDKEVPQDPNNEEPKENDPDEEKVSEFVPGVEIYSAPDRNNTEPGFYVVQTGAYKTKKYLDLAVKNLINAGVYPRIVEDRLSLIYTVTDSRKESANKIVEILNKEGFESYLQPLSYNLSKVEKETLLNEVEDVVSTISELVTNGIANKDPDISEEQVILARLKIDNYDKKVQLILSQIDNEGRKKELQETRTILNQMEDELRKTDGELENLWKVEGLLLDYMLILNGYVPMNK